MLRRIERRLGPRRYPYTIEWTGEHHAVAVTIRINVPARRRFEWSVEIEGVPSRPPRIEDLENIETDERTVLRRALGRVELAYRMKLGARSAAGIGYKRERFEVVWAFERARLLREARAKARRERVARVQPDLPGVE